MNSQNPHDRPFLGEDGRDFADFIAGSQRMDTENIPIPGDDKDEARLGSGSFADEPEAAKRPTISPESPEAEVIEAKRAETAPTVEEKGEAFVQERSSARATTGNEKPLAEDNEPDGETETDERPGVQSHAAKVKKKSEKKNKKSSIDEDLNPELRDRAEVIGTTGRWFAGWCLRFIIIAAALYLGFQVFGKLWAGILPVCLSVIVCTVLWPVVRVLRKAKVPNSLAVLIAILGFFALIIGTFAAIAPSAVDQGKTIVNQASDGIGRIQDWLQGPPVNLQESQFNDGVQQITDWLQNKSGDIATSLAAFGTETASLLVTMFVMLVLTFFFLKDGENFLPMLRRVTGRRVGWHLTEVLTRCWNTLGGFIRTQAIVSAIDAIFIGLGLVLLNVPLAGPLAILTFFGGFIPMVGAFVAGALSVLIALVAVDFNTAVMALLLVIAVQQLEGNILQPVLQSRAMNVHPVIILLSVTLGSTLFGIIGAFLAVPCAAMIAVILRYMGDLTDLATGEKTSRDIEFATTAGSLTGEQSERAAQRWQELRKAMMLTNSKKSEANQLNEPRHGGTAQNGQSAQAPRATQTATQDMSSAAGDGGVSTETAGTENEGASSSNDTKSQIRGKVQSILNSLRGNNK